MKTSPLPLISFSALVSRRCSPRKGREGENGRQKKEKKCLHTQFCPQLLPQHAIICCLNSKQWTARGWELILSRRDKHLGFSSTGKPSSKSAAKTTQRGSKLRGVGEARQLAGLRRQQVVLRTRQQHGNIWRCCPASENCSHGEIL